MLPQTSPLVGRDAVLAELGAWVAEARDGRGGLVLLTGEAGIGKTRLAEELVRRSDAIAPHWAWCRAEQTAGSLRTWSTVLRALTATSTSVADLAANSPALRTLVSGAPEGSSPHPDASRAVLAAEMAQALRLAGESPRLIVLDDLHDAEASTLRLLVDVCAELRGTGVLVVATARDTGWDGREALRAELLRQGRRVALQPLTAADVEALLGPEDAARTDQLLARTGGNPLLLTELASSHEGVPASLRALVAARLAGSDATTQEVIEAAAVLGPRFRLDVLAEVTEIPLDQLASHFAPDLLSAGSAGEARFMHELLRDAVYAELEPAQQRAWHARAGAVLDRLRERGRMVAPAEVAHHLLLAGPEHAALAAQRCLDAADNAERVQAYEDAAHWYHQALDLLDDPAAQAEVLVRRARARRGYGDRAGAREDLLQAGSLAQQAKRPDLLAQAALGLGTGPGGFEVDQEDVAQIDLLELALATLPPEDLALRATVLARLSVARYRVDAQEEIEARAREAVELGRASGDRLALGVSLAALCDAIGGPDHVHERLAHAGEVVDLALQERQGDLELLGRRLRFLALTELGNRPEAEREIRLYELRANEVRHPLYLWLPPMWRSMWAMAEGRYAESQQLLDEANRLGEGSANAELLTAVGRWGLSSWSGDEPTLREVFDGFTEANFQDLWAQITRALISAQLGDLVAARAHFDLAAPRLGEIARDSEWLPTMAQAAEVVEHLGGHPAAAWLFDTLLPYANLFAVEGLGAVLRGPVQLFLSYCAPDPATRAEHQRQAEALLRRVGAVARPEAAAAITTSTAGAALRREGEVWAFTWQGRETRVKDSKGLRDLAALLGRPGQEVPALDLYGGPVEHDTGEVLDASAREAYKRRLAELEDQESLSEAEATERSLLLEQLASAYGLGGRARRTGSSAERARSAVTARLRETVKRVGELDPDLGRHLTHSLRTGTFCSYAPEMPVMWHLTP